MRQYIYSILLGLLVAGCSGPDNIPLSTMEKIISESMLSTAVAETNSTPDTVDCYLPILQKYGYTMADFRHTAYSMSTRKSNPLNEIFGRVAVGFDSVALMAEYRYNISMRYDTLALNFYADTVYRKDTTIKGSLSKYHIRLTNLKKGTYTVGLDYTTMADYRFGTKALTHRTGTKGVKQIVTPTRSWLNRVSDKTPFSTSVNIEKSTDSLIISFFEPSMSKERKRDGVKDTSFISNIMVVYRPDVIKARRDYYLRFFDSIQLYQIIKNEKDSLPVHFRSAK